MDFLLTAILGFFVFLTGLLPFRLLYVLSDLLRFVLYHVFKYRRKVVEENIQNSFPDLSAAEQKKIAKLSYKNLADIIIEGIKGFTISNKQVLARHKIINPEFLSPFIDSGKSVLLLPTHYANWEWGVLSFTLQSKYDKIVVLYKPLSNKFADRMVKKNRSRSGVFMGSMYKMHETAKLFQTGVSQAMAFFLVADQSPSNSRKAIWVNFLCRETAFLRGPEYYSRLYNFPVIYPDIQRVKRGYYEIKYTLLTDNPASLPQGEVTAIYARKLEEIIRKKPENWLWSHRRWKLKKV